MAAPLSQEPDRRGAASAEKSAPEDADGAIPRPREPAPSSTLPRPLRPHALAPRGDVAYVPGFVSEKEEEALLRHLQPTTTTTRTAAAAADTSGGPPPPSSLAPGWKIVSGRRLRVLGGSVQGEALTAAELPSWLLPLIERLRLTGAYAEEAGAGGGGAPSAPSPPPPPPNHALVNCYSPAQGILPHEDGPLYHPAAAIVSLGSWAVLRFYSKRKSEDEKEAEGGGEKEQEEKEQEEKEEGEEKGKRVDKDRNVFSVALAPRSLVVFTGEAYKTLLHGIDAAAEDALDASILNREDEQVRRASRGGAAEAAAPRSPSGGSLRVIPRGGGGGEGGGGAGERISLTVRRVLRVRRNLLRLGPRLGPR